MDADTAVRIKALLASVVGFVLELIGWQGGLALIYGVLMLIDWITGTQAAKAAGEWDSEVAKSGIKSKGITMGVVAVAFLLDATLYLIADEKLGFAVPLNGTIFGPMVLVWYIFTEAGSIVENLGKRGVPVPPWLAKGIKVLTAKVDKQASNQQTEGLTDGWETEHSAMEDDLQNDIV